MIKPASLRAALVGACPELARDPARLQVFVDRGRLVSRRTPNLGFEYRYTMRLFFEAFTGSPDDLMVPIVLWLREHQPDLFLRFDQDEAVQFSADILDDQSWDVAVTFELTEAVRVKPRPCGGWEVIHLTEPSPDDVLLAGASGEVPLDDLNWGMR